MTHTYQDRMMCQCGGEHFRYLVDGWYECECGRSEYEDNLIVQWEDFYAENPDLLEEDAD